MDVNEELKFLWKLKKKIWGGGGRGGHIIYSLYSISC